MFDFLRKPGLRRPSVAMRRALEAESLPTNIDVAALGVLTARGSYAGRKVTYFRIVDPNSAAAHVADVFPDLSYEGLDAHPDLVLRAGFLEQSGTVVVVYRRPRPESRATPGRAAADRAAHVDDERFVFPDTDAAREQARS